MGTVEPLALIRTDSPPQCPPTPRPPPLLFFFLSPVQSLRCRTAHEPNSLACRTHGSQKLRRDQRERKKRGGGKKRPPWQVERGGTVGTASGARRSRKGSTQTVPGRARGSGMGGCRLRHRATAGAGVTRMCAWTCEDIDGVFWGGGRRLDAVLMACQYEPNGRGALCPHLSRRLARLWDPVSTPGPPKKH